MKKKFFCLLFFLLLFSSSVFAASTITIQDLPSHSAAPASSDLFILYDTSESVTSKITAAFLLSILDGANITADSITDAAINFSSLTLDDFTFDVGSVDKTEFGYVNGVTSSIQDQLNTKAAKGANTDITSLTGMTTPLGAAYGGSGVANNALSTWTISGNYPTTITVTGITSVTMPTTGTLLTTTGSGAGLTALNGENISNNTIDDDSLNFTDITLNDFTFDVGDVDKTEFSYIDGGTSSFQDQIDGKLSTTGSASGLSGYSLGAQPLHANLTYLSLGINPLSGSPWPAAPTGTNLVQGFPYWANGLDWDPLSRQKTTGAIATIAFVEGGASADTITDSGNGFVTAGIAEHMRIKVSGSGSNDGYYTIDTVTAGTITLVTTDDLVDEAASATITILAAYRYEVRNNQGIWVGLWDEYGNLFASSFNMADGTAILPNGTSNATLTTPGQIHVNTTQEQVSFHSAADGEISGEVALSLLVHLPIVIDPSWAYDQSATYHTYPVMYVGDDFPEGFTMTEWKVNYVSGDPTTELDADIVFDTTPDFNPAAGATVMDVIDTTAGASAADTGFDSATASNGSRMYIRFGADPTDANVLVAIDIWGYAEED